MNFISICSGIEAASVAFGPLGWKAVAFSEIEPFPCAVLAHHYPDVPNFGDMTKFREWPEEIFANADAVVGGPPCQAFSVAGTRNGLNDDRGNLTLTYAELINHADAIRFIHGKPPVVVLYENVPGLLSDKTGAFGCFLAGLAGEDEPLVAPGGKWTNAGCVLGPKRAVAWRLLDAQFFGVAQRRRRVFVIASARKGFDPAQVLFEWDGVRRDSAPSREAREVAPTIPARSTAGGGLGTDFDCDGGLIEASTHRMVAFGEYRDDGSTTVVQQPVAYGIRTANTSSNGWGIQEECTHTLDCAQGVAVAQPVAFHPTQDPISSTDGSTHALGCGSTGGQASVAVAVALRGREGGATAELGDEGQNCLRASSGGGDKPRVLTDMQVRRLTPTEAERLQGFSDGYTAIPWRGKPADQCPDGPRYKALGNSWAIPCVSWIGERIQRHLAGDL